MAMASLFERFGRHAGLISPLIFLICMLSAAANYRGYDPVADYISHLGINPHSALIFNSGILLSGIFGIMFSFYLWKRLPAGPAKSGAFMMGTAMASCAMLAFFPESVLSFHIFFAGMSFSLALSSIIAIGSSLRYENPRIGGLSLLLAALILTLPLSAFHPLAEHLAAGAIVAWSLLMWHYLGTKDSYLRYEWVWM